MRKFKYFDKRKEILFFDNLEVLSLNETASDIFACFIAAKSATEAARHIESQYEISSEEASLECASLYEQFKLKGLTQVVSNGLPLETEWAPNTPIIHVIENCNSACRMCDCWKTKEDKWISLALLQKLFAKLKEKGARAVMISGGEPLLHPEITEITKSASSLGLSVELNTNGINLDNNTWINEKIVDRVIISLDGFDAKSYQKYRGARAFDKIMNSVKELKKRSPSLKIGFRITLNRYTLDNFGLALELLKEYPIEGIGISPADVGSTSFSRSSMNDKRRDDLVELLIPTFEEISRLEKVYAEGSPIAQEIDAQNSAGKLSWSSTQFRKCIKFYRGIRENNPIFSDDQPCFFPKTSMILDYDGSMKHCFYSEPFGHINKLDSVDWNSTQKIDAIVASGKCKSCRGKLFCGTGG